MLELWGMRSTPSSPSLPGSVRPRVLAPDMVLTIGKKGLNCVRMLNWLAWNRTVLIFILRTWFELRTYAKQNCLKENCFDILDCVLVGQMGWMFANDLGDLCSIPGRVVPNTFKMVLDTSLLNTQQYKVRIKDKMGQSRERSCALPYTLV